MQMLNNQDLRHLCEVFSSDFWAAANQISNECAALNGADLLERRRRGHAELMEILRQQKRALDFHAGVPVEPEAHEAGAVLLPMFGGGSLG